MFILIFPIIIDIVIKLIIKTIVVVFSFISNAFLIETDAVDFRVQKYRQTSCLQQKSSKTCQKSLMKVNIANFVLERKIYLREKRL